VTTIPAANLFCGHFCFLILNALNYNCIHPTWIQLIYHTPLPSFTVTGISFAVVYSSVSGIWYVNLWGLIFGLGIFQEALDIFFVFQFFSL